MTAWVEYQVGQKAATRHLYSEAVWDLLAIARIIRLELADVA